MGKKKVQDRMDQQIVWLKLNTWREETRVRSRVNLGEVGCGTRQLRNRLRHRATICGVTPSGLWLLANLFQLQGGSDYLIRHCFLEGKQFLFFF